MENDILDNEEETRIYSKISIVFLSFFGSTIIGGLLLAINLKKLEKRESIAGVIGFGIIWSLLITQLHFDYPYKRLIVMILFNLIGGYILVTPVWNHIIGKELKYKAKSILIPLTLLLLLMIAMIYFVTLY